MDLVLVGDLGNAAFSLCRHPTFAAGHLFVETVHVIESAAPRRLQIGRFLPPALIETALDAQGNEISQDARAAFREVQGDVSVEAVSGFARGQKRLIESLIARAEQFAERRLREKVADAETAMLTTMTEELKRLAALRRVNPLVRKQELDQLKEEAVELHHCLQSAQLRLEALRLIITV
jgi:ATP-dependent helicase HepA